MKILKIKLKQHTPMIHFQHDQEGATLRASEVKPKLDKYILTKLGKGNYEAGIKKAKENKWILGDHNALNYKMRIEASHVQVWDMKQDSGRKNKEGKAIYDSIPLYFGNMPSKDDINYHPKQMSFCANPIIMHIISIEDDKGLLKCIEENIFSFFSYNNFGTRQSKGFGCFYPLSDNSNDSTRFVLSKGYASFSLPKNEFGTWNSFKKLFDSIDLFYKTLRSGINHNNVYLKSLMYFYADDQNSYWDKRTIRHAFNLFFPDVVYDKGEKKDKKDGIISEINKKSRLYRDMLGLSSSQEWRKYNDTITKVNLPESKKKEDAIDRFKSPLLIKPIYSNGRFDIYLIPMSIPEEYKNAEFEISSKKRVSSFKMRTPSTFDIDDYLQFVTDEGITNWVINELEKFTDIRNKRTQEIVSTLKFIFGNITYNY